MSATQPKLENSVVHGATKTRWKSNGGIRFISCRLSVTHHFVRPLRRGGAALHVRKAGNGTAMGVVRGVGQPAFQIAHDFVAKDVLDFLGVLVDVISGDLCGVGEVK